MTATREQLARGIALYQGNFLQGFYLRDSPGFEEWMVAEQERLKRLVGDAMLALIGNCIERHEYSTGIEYAARLLTLDPLREEPQRQMMEMLARSAQGNSALVQYESYRRQLMDELGVGPGVEITAPYERIRSGGI